MRNALLSILLFICAVMGAANAHARAEAPRLNINSDYSAVAVVPGKPVTINILITIETPAITQRVVRQPVAVSLVIDHSGSMSSAKKLDYAIQAGKVLVRGLEKNDQFSLVIYDDKVKVLYPLGKIKDKEHIYNLLDSIQPGGYTFLSGGLEKGISQFANKSFGGVRRVVLLSDGLANRGITNPEQVAAIAYESRKKGVNVSSVGLGLDYDEDMMQLIAQRGGGQYYYVKDSEDLPSIFQRELALATDAYTCNLNTRVIFSPRVSSNRVYGYNTGKENKETRVEMSELSSGEKRQMLMSVTFTPDSSGGKQHLGDLRMVYNDADGKEQVVEAPLAVTLAATEADAAKANAKAEVSIRKVQDEILIAQADEAQVAAMKALEQGKKDEAKKILSANAPSLAAAAPRNREVAAKAEQLKFAEESLDAAAQDVELRQSMVKSSKNTAYLSSQGVKQGILLQSGDKGTQVEKLQKTLAAKGFYSGPINGVYSDAVTEAVKAYQKANSITADGVSGPATLRSLGM